MVQQALGRNPFGNLLYKEKFVSLRETGFLKG
jgi:hypothetical protein